MGKHKLCHFSFMYYCFSSGSHFQCFPFNVLLPLLNCQGTAISFVSNISKTVKTLPGKLVSVVCKKSCRKQCISSSTPYNPSSSCSRTKCGSYCWGFLFVLSFFQIKISYTQWNNIYPLQVMSTPLFLEKQVFFMEL